MYRKDVNERSPMRVFENSLHGGLGRGNLGVVASRTGVGKTATLVQIALDDLLRGRKVLHISREQAVDHVRAYYDEIFHDLAHACQLESPAEVRLDVERNRLIFSHLGHENAEPPSTKGAETALRKIIETIAFAHDVAHFDPDAIIIEGFDFARAPADALTTLRALAKEHEAEMWLSARCHGPFRPELGVPAPVDRFTGDVAVVVYLEQEKEVVRLRLLKDHQNNDLVDLHLRLDPHSMRVLDEDVRTASDRPRGRLRARLYSGGARGSEAEFGRCAERWGIAETHFSFEGHALLDRSRGVTTLSPSELRKGDFSLLFASKRLGRTLSQIPLVRSILQSIWHQISAATQVFVIGSIQQNDTVRGGTGWGAELARLWRKPLFVYDQTRHGWFRWSGSAWEIARDPLITSEAFAGIGTQHLTEDGKNAIHDLFLRSFGAPEG